MAEKETLHVAIPTATIIIASEQSSFQVLALKSKRHPGKLILPGGKVRTGIHEPSQTVLIEAQEEAGITEIKNLRFLTVNTEIGRDVRDNVPIAVFCDERSVPSEFPESLCITGHHSFDFVYTATTMQKGVPDGEEASAIEWIDLTDLEARREYYHSKFALGHGSYLEMYFETLVDRILEDATHGIF